VTDPIVGIDLGTSNTVVAYADATGSVRVLADEAGYKIHPSVVSFHPSGGVVVGAPAKQRKVIDPKNTIFSVKRLIGRPFSSPEVTTARKRMPYQIKEGEKQLPKVVTRGGEFAIPEISAIVLDHVRNVAAAQLQTEVNRAVVTVPAAFNDSQRSATATAGAIAGLTIVRVLNEPTAAALAYGNARSLRETIAVYDFGGGTFDISILRLNDQVYEVLGTAGDTFLGGDDLDERLVDRMVEKFLRENRIDLRTNEVSMMRLRAVAEQTKIELSRRSRAVVRVDEIAYGPSGKPLDLQIEIARDEFVRQVADIIDKTFPVCQEAMRLAQLDPDLIDDVILVGGTTKIPYVRDQVSKFFQKAPRTDVNPEDAVAIGAAHQATALERILKRKTPSRQPTEASDSFTSEAPSEVDTFTGETTQGESRVASLDDELQQGSVLTLTDDGSRPAAGYAQLSPTLDPRQTQRNVERGAAVDRVQDRPTPPAIEAGAQALGRITKPQGTQPTTPPATNKTLFGVPSAPSGPDPVAPPPRTTGKIPAPPPPPPPPRTASMPVPRIPAPPPPPAPAPPVPQASPHARTMIAEPQPGNTAQGFGAVGSAASPPQPRQQAPLAEEIGFHDVSTVGPSSTDSAITGLDLSLPPASTARGFEPPHVFPPSAPTYVPQSQPIYPPQQAAPQRAPVVMDVTPRGLGVGTVAGFCEELIRRNSRVPAEIRRLFTTSRDLQEAVRIIVCQGESRRLEENVVIGDLVLTELPPRPRGETSIEVTFLIDASGILQVRARDAQTGREQRAAIEVLGDITEDDVAASRDRLRMLRG
jgi:molecular chaperone DnaK